MQKKLDSKMFMKIQKDILKNYLIFKIKKDVLNAVKLI